MVFPYTIKAQTIDKPLRLDVFLASAIGQKENLSRSVIQQMIAKGLVCVNDKTQRNVSLKIKGGETITVEELTLGKNELAPTLTVLYEDQDFVAIHKPANLLTHPTSSLAFTLDKDMMRNLAILRTPSVLNWILKCYPRSSLIPRFGIVHRLDSATSGVLLIAKTKSAYNSAIRLFSTRKIRKTYRVLAWGKVSPKEGVIAQPLAKRYKAKVKIVLSPTGKTAETAYKVLSSYDWVSDLEAYPKTGRTHQIRVHLASLGHPICGDPIYRISSLKNVQRFDRLMLHARKLEFIHPKTGKKVEITAPFPQDFIEEYKKHQLNF